LEDNRSMTQVFLVITTVPTHDEAMALSRQAVVEGFAVCAQIQAPCQSVYQWHGSIEEAKEYPIHFKTNQRMHQDLRDFIARKHSYDVPEIISIQVDTVNESYAAWLDASLDKQGQ